MRRERLLAVYRFSVLNDPTAAGASSVELSDLISQGLLRGRGRAAAMHNLRLADRRSPVNRPSPSRLPARYNRITWGA